MRFAPMTKEYKALERKVFLVIHIRFGRPECFPFIKLRRNRFAFCNFSAPHRPFL